MSITTILSNKNPEFASEETYAEARKAYETVSIMSAEQTARK